LVGVLVGVLDGPVPVGVFVGVLEGVGGRKKKQGAEFEGVRVLK